MSRLWAPRHSSAFDPTADQDDLSPRYHRLTLIERTLGRKLVRCGAFALVLAATACAKTLYESYRLDFDASAATRSPSIESDRLGVNLLISYQTTVSRPGHVVYKGPYAFLVEIYDGDRSRGMLAAIDVSEAVLEIRNGDAEVRRLALSTTPDDWKRYLQSDEFGRKWLRFVLSKTPPLDIDFGKLKEIWFRLEFTGTYPNGDRREYWVEQHLKPKLIREELNDFELFIRGV